jgi:hypothetical protein
MATSKAYDVTNERMNPDGGGNVAGRFAASRTRLLKSPVDLDVGIEVVETGAHGSNLNGRMLGNSKGFSNSPVKGKYKNHRND